MEIVHGKLGKYQAIVQKQKRSSVPRQRSPPQKTKHKMKKRSTGEHAVVLVPTRNGK
jgi:hypothetical protein